MIIDEIDGRTASVSIDFLTLHNALYLTAIIFTVSALISGAVFYLYFSYSGLKIIIKNEKTNIKFAI